jgi:hypothetical protein
MIKAEEYVEEVRELDGIPVRITVYKISGEFHCHIFNADAGATIARGSATDRDTALQVALQKAAKRLHRAHS